MITGGGRSGGRGWRKGMEERVEEGVEEGVGGGSLLLGKERHKKTMDLLQC